jgi:hypothetical protein
MQTIDPGATGRTTTRLGFERSSLMLEAPARRLYEMVQGEIVTQDQPKARAVG